MALGNQREPENLVVTTLRQVPEESSMFCKMQELSSELHHGDFGG
jgi:hypothetical protein